jgi:hypothetical protein
VRGPGEGSVDRPGCWPTGVVPVLADADGRLRVGEAELRGPFYKDRDVLADGTFVERTVFLGHDVLDLRTLFMREALGQTVNDSHKGFGFLDHCKSFGPIISRVKGVYSWAPGGRRRCGLHCSEISKKSCDRNFPATWTCNLSVEGDPIMDADERLLPVPAATWRPGTTSTPGTNTPSYTGDGSQGRHRTTACSGSWTTSRAGAACWTWPNWRFSGSSTR